MKNKYLIIHGHFYQPPRHNPWIGTVEKIDTPHARMIEGYNEQIDIQCYTSNAFAYAFMDHEIQVVNNYEYLSFNFGPTLLSWLELHNPMTYQKLLQADQKSLERLGHGNAIGQIYNHIIMPLASKEDQQTQIAWAVSDFKRRFQRDPESLWLSELAVDHQTIEALFRANMKYGIVSSKGLKKAFDRKQQSWVYPQNPNKPYFYHVEGAHFPLFFVNDFFYEHVGGMLKDGERFFEVLRAQYQDNDEPEVVTICTDGELYGHWEPYGERFLSYVFYQGCQKHGIIPTNFATYLSLHPPEEECELFHSSSWSCIHGLGRWQENCGCSDEDHNNQEFRKPLRNALNQLRDSLFKIYMSETSPYLTDPLEARNEIIDYDFADELSRREFFSHHLKPEHISLEHGIEIGLTRLMLSQYYSQLMFTSCAWFFSHMHRIETRTILQYAAKALEFLSLPSLISSVQEKFLEQLEKIPIEIPESQGINISNGKQLYLFETVYRTHKTLDEMSVVKDKDRVLIKVPYDLVGECAYEFIHQFTLVSDSLKNARLVLDLNAVTQIDQQVIAFFKANIPLLLNRGLQIQFYCLRKGILELLYLSHIEEFVEIISPKIL